MKKNSLLKNAFLNGLKTISSILFPFITFSYCSRVLGADNIGIYSFSQSIISYIILIAGLGISNYAIREGAALINQDDELKKFINEIFSINVLSTLFSYIILIFLIVFIPKVNLYKNIVFILSFQVLLTTIGTDWINIIYEDYLYLTIRYIIVQLFSLIFVFILVKSRNDILIYSIIMLFSSSFGYFLNVFYLRKKGIYLKLNFKVDIKRHIKPIMILFTNSIASIIYLNSDITMIGFMMDESHVGVYSASSKIYSMTKSLITSIILVTLPRFSYLINKKQKDKYSDYLSKIFIILFIITLPVMVGLFMESKNILLFLVGSEYVIGASVVKILSIAIGFAIFACFFSYSILIPNKMEKYFMYSTISASIINILFNFILIPVIGIDAAAYTTLISEIIVFSITFISSNKIVHFKFLYKDILKSIIGCILIIFIDFLINKISPFTSLVTLIINILICSISYFGFLALTKCSIIYYLNCNIGRK